MNEKRHCNRRKTPITKKENKSSIVNKPDISNYWYVTANYGLEKRRKTIYKLIFICRNLNEANHVYSQINKLPTMKYVMISETKPDYFLKSMYFAGISQYTSGRYSVQIVDHNTLSWSEVYKQGNN